MAWKEVLVMEERSCFVLLAEKRQQSFSSLCKESTGSAGRPAINGWNATGSMGCVLCGSLVAAR
jgi:hypothetical protein